MRVVSIHQPPYFPWLGLVDKIARSDVFVVLDTVQYSRRAFLHRTLYSTENGAKYLSLPVTVEASGAAPKIMDARLAEPQRLGKQLETLRHRYRRAEGWSVLQQVFAAMDGAAPEGLVDLNVALMKQTLQAFGIEPEIVLASSLNATGAKSELMLNLTRAVGGDVYLSGSGAESYIEPEIFEQASVGLWWQKFQHPTYRQSHGGPFVPGCFALEWMVEDPECATSGFQDHLRSTGMTPPRCLGAREI